MLTDDNLNLTKEEIDMIAKDAEINEKKKESKPQKKSKVIKKVEKKVIENTDSSDYSDDE